MNKKICFETPEYWEELAKTERAFANQERGSKFGTVESIRIHEENARIYEANAKVLRASK